MLDVIMWIIIIALFILSFVGLLFPIVPSVLVLWVGFLLYHFVLNGDQLNIVFWIAMVFFTIILIVADIVANSYFVKRFGGSKWGERGAAIAVIVGSFVVPPFGIIIVPFIAVLLIEIIQKRTMKESVMASIGSLLGFLGGTFAKIIVQLIMIIWFLLVVIF
ncbi:DUF456 domain-containing protein [Ornithinibacillus halophilus]|uniref:DUF456 domain-containing protein n=1 Tax=Ornithinibacillus halophilus TaxID=930117 RepID=A0A1M5GZG6_9BACI|nr:DUF456 family protein [Ornithinibacillus halophilus]SHG09058.1 hypothetical protein SAMN05216225_101531 [Ornithinibacillus halophilus]